MKLVTFQEYSWIMTIGIVNGVNLIWNTHRNRSAKNTALNIIGYDIKLDWPVLTYPWKARLPKQQYHPYGRTSAGWWPSPSSHCRRGLGRRIPWRALQPVERNLVLRLEDRNVAAKLKEARALGVAYLPWWKRFVVGMVMVSNGLLMRCLAVCFVAIFFSVKLWQEVTLSMWRFGF